MTQRDRTQRYECHAYGDTGSWVVWDRDANGIAAVRPDAESARIAADRLNNLPVPDAAGVVADLGALADDVMRRGEANRGRPDPVTDPLVVSDIGALWKRVAALEQQLAEVKATTDMLNAVVGRLLPA